MLVGIGALEGVGVAGKGVCVKVAVEGGNVGVGRAINKIGLVKISLIDFPFSLFFLLISLPEIG